MASGCRIWRASAAILVGDLSPNGRVLPTSIPGGTALIDIESGESLARVQAIFPRDFEWLGQDRALIHRSAMMSSFTIDFDSGTEHVVKFSKEAIDRVVALRAHNEFFALTDLSVLRLRAGDGRTDESLTLLDQKPFKIQNWQRNEGEMTVDGRFYVIAAQDLNFISSDTLESTRSGVGPFEIRTIVPQPDPDLLLLIGENPGIDPNMGMRYYMYSISRETFAPLDAAYRNQGRIVYLANIRKLGFVTQNRIALLDKLPVDDPMTHDDFVAFVTREQDQHRSATARESRGPQLSGTGPVRVETIPGARVTDADLRHELDRVVGACARQCRRNRHRADEQICHEAGWDKIGSCHRPRQARSGRAAGVAAALLHEAVRWMLDVERGTIIQSIMTAGPHPSEVVGAGAVPVTHLTDLEASQTNTPQYEGLQAQVMNSGGR